MRVLCPECGSYTVEECWLVNGRWYCCEECARKAARNL